MSSSPFWPGMPQVVDDFVYDPPFEKAGIQFIMRGKDEADAIRRLKLTLRSVPQDMEMLIHHIGMRPDKPVPVARYFIEALIHNPDDGADVFFGSMWFWHGVWQGKKGTKPWN